MKANPRFGKIMLKLWLDKAELNSLKEIRNRGIEIGENQINIAGDILITAMRRGDLN
jgi:hypothetical protein